MGYGINLTATSLGTTYLKNPTWSIVWLVYNRVDSSESDSAVVTTSHVSYCEKCCIPSIIQTYFGGVGEQNEQLRHTGYSGLWIKKKLMGL